MVLEDLGAKRDYVYIDDLINAFILAIERRGIPEVSIYNICTGKSFSAFQIVRKISKIKGVDIKVKSNPTLIRTDEEKDEYGSFEKVKKTFGWEPKKALRKA